ncbi:Uncharacterised protein [Mycobacteroides abscessus subsp. abscessus]|nr:Uncharacterised protein [Mycobacteroides abscessus subsp. abscessus]
MTMECPPAASRCAEARPIPAFAPVMTTVFGVPGMLNLLVETSRTPKSLTRRLRGVEPRPATQGAGLASRRATQLP